MELRTRTSPEQFMALVEFMERYGDLSRPAPGLQGRINSQKLWEELANNLNSMSMGVCKTTDKWKKVWADWKTKTKKKFLRIRRHELQTGDTQGRQSLTSLEERLVIMMGVAAMADRPGLPDQDDNTQTEETVDQNSFNGYSSDSTLPDIGASTKISSAERWKRKKAGIVDESGKIVTRITELANQILTKTGNMDIYQETYEKISNILDKDKKKHEDADLDMYADDFDQKEKATLGQPQTSDGDDKTEESEDQNTNIVKWEFKWSQDDNAEISGPHSTEQMHKWSEEGYFKTGVWVRKHGEDTQFYSSNRMDFELYI